MKISFSKAELNALNKIKEVVSDIAWTIGIKPKHDDMFLTDLDKGLKPGAVYYSKRRYADIDEDGNLNIKVNEDYLIGGLEICTEYLTKIKTPLKNVLIAWMNMFEVIKLTNDSMKLKIEEFNNKYKD
jgi:hypothetical protein